MADITSDQVDVFSEKASSVTGAPRNQKTDSAQRREGAVSDLCRE
jgi:hypothetical protein